VVTVLPADVEPMAQDRAKRVARLRAPGAPRLWLVVGEEALYRAIRGPKALRGQLEQIRDLAELENVSVQVMPFEAGAHASHGVSFSIVNLVEGRNAPHASGGLLVKASRVSHLSLDRA
jgi:uncharacterized protein DUF5753